MTIADTAVSVPRWKHALVIDHITIVSMLSIDYDDTNDESFLFSLSRIF